MGCEILWMASDGIFSVLHKVWCVLLKITLIVEWYIRLLPSYNRASCPNPRLLGKGQDTPRAICISHFILFSISHFMLFCISHFLLHCISHFLLHCISHFLLHCISHLIVSQPTPTWKRTRRAACHHPDKKWSKKENKATIAICQILVHGSSSIFRLMRRV